MADADRLTLTLSTGGDVVIKLRPDLAPGHVERITELANSGFYDGVMFHRVIPGFMAQGGDPTGTGSGGSDLPDLKAEFSDEPHVRGTVSMARTPNPDSANSQFFICFDDAALPRRPITVGARSRAGWNMSTRCPWASRRASPARSSRRRWPVRKVALITGASAGLGVEFARQLSDRGHRLVLAARRKDRLDALARSLAMPAPSRSIVESGFGGEADGGNRSRRAKQIDILVNNAGFGLIGRFAELDAGACGR